MEDSSWCDLSERATGREGEWGALGTQGKVVVVGVLGGRGSLLGHLFWAVPHP